MVIYFLQLLIEPEEFPPTQFAGAELPIPARTICFFVSNVASWYWYLLIYLSRYFDQETAKGLLWSSCQATTCYYLSNQDHLENLV